MASARAIIGAAVCHPGDGPRPGVQHPRFRVMLFREWADPEGMPVALLAWGIAAVLCPAGTAGASLLPPPPPLPTLPPPPDVTGTIDDLLGTLGTATAPDGGGSPSGGSGVGTSGSGGAGGGDISSGTGSSGDATGAKTAPGAPPSPAALDTRAPRVKLKVRSSFAWVARTGRLKVRVTSDEPGVVAVGGTLRVRGKVTRLRAGVLGYRSPRTLTATLKLPRAALRSLARARNVRLSLNAIAVDVARNRRTATLKVTLTRPGKVVHLRHPRRSGGRRAVDSPG